MCACVRACMRLYTGCSGTPGKSGYPLMDMYVDMYVNFICSREGAHLYRERDTLYMYICIGYKKFLLSLFCNLLKEVLSLGQRDQKNIKKYKYCSLKVAESVGNFFR